MAIEGVGGLLTRIAFGVRVHWMQPFGGLRLSHGHKISDALVEDNALFKVFSVRTHRRAGLVGNNAMLGIRAFSVQVTTCERRRVNDLFLCFAKSNLFLADFVHGRSNCGVVCDHFTNVGKLGRPCVHSAPRSAYANFVAYTQTAFQ